jgi:hypothetical protein
MEAFKRKLTDVETSQLNEIYELAEGPGSGQGYHFHLMMLLEQLGIYTNNTREATFLTCKILAEGGAIPGEQTLAAWRQEYQDEQDRADLDRYLDMADEDL